MKKLNLNFIVFFVIIIFISYTHGRLRDDQQRKFDKLRMTPKIFEKMQNMHKNTYYTAVKAIIGKMGSILYKELPKAEKRFLARCLDKIEDRRELISSAKCVVIARKRLLKIKSEITQKHLKATTQRPNQNWKSFLQQFDDFDRLHSFSQSQTNGNWTNIPKYRISKRKYLFSKTSYNFSPVSKRKQQNGFFGDTEVFKKPANQQLASKHNSFIQAAPNQQRKSFIDSKPNSVRKKGYERFNLLSKKFKKISNVNLSPTRRNLKVPKPFISKRFLKFKQRRTKRHTRFADAKDGYYYKEEKFKVVTKKSFDGLVSRKPDNKIISSVTNVIQQFVANEESRKDQGMEHLKWTKTYKRLMKVREAIDEKKTVPGAKVYEKRMYDIVLDRDEPSLSPSERKSPQGIIHDSMKLLGSLTSNSSTNATGSQFRYFSPRFMPLMPLNEGKRQPDTYLSPTIMAMYDEPQTNNTNNINKEINVGNVPKAMTSLGISQRDQSKLMQMLMDVSGTSTYVDEALKLYDVLGMFDEDVGEPILNATEKIMGAFKHLEKNLFPDQKYHFDNRGFAFIKKQQMEKLLKDQEIPEGEIDLADFDIYDKMTDEQMEISLWKTIENIANNKTDVLRPSEVHRYKRNNVFFLTPSILSPLLFTVQSGIIIIGPLIISPLAFSPPILGPSIFSPWILSPGIFNPLILSPYILTPFILGPLAFTPFILTPYFLSPNILNPYLITSLILSPIGLSPDILSPQAIGATILSPSVLSPPVLNPTIYTTIMFSPSFLS